MYLKTVRAIAKPQHFAIIDLLKRSTGMPVAAIARALGLSYMGVKQHCVDLEKKGFLDTWRVPVPTGRPEKHYRLTEKAAAFFPEAGNPFALELLIGVQAMHGPTAAERLLYHFFNTRAEAWAKRIKGRTVAERAAVLAKLRDAEGHFAQVEYHPKHGLCIVEYHSPLQLIADRFPSLHRMEEQLFTRLLNSEVRRTEERAAGLTRAVFAVSTLGSP